ncbi:MAG: hypothetical protein IT376_07485 [Polyangiaceae bacterium]|nr:hypothetical protein [Polyangiaceae bacterium]
MIAEARGGLGVALPRPERVGALASALGGSVDPGGCTDLVVRRVVPPGASTEPTDLVLVASTRVLAEAERAPGVLLCAEALASRVASGRRWTHSHPQWVVARLLAPVAPRSVGGIHPTAVVEAGATVGLGAVVSEGAVVRAGAVVGPGAQIGVGAVIHGGVRLGARVIVGDGAVVGRPGFGWVEGPDGARLRMPQLGGVDVGDDAEIGPLCTVDAGTLGPTTLGPGVKLDAHVHVGHNVALGAGCVVAAQVGFAGSASIGAGTLIGGQAGFADHVRVGARARVAGKSGVIGEVPAGTTVAGFPAVPRARWLRAMAALLERAGPRGRRPR